METDCPLQTPEFPRFFPGDSPYTLTTKWQSCFFLLCCNVLSFSSTRARTRAHTNTHSLAPSTYQFRLGALQKFFHVVPSGLDQRYPESAEDYLLRGETCRVPGQGPARTQRPAAPSYRSEAAEVVAAPSSVVSQGSRPTRRPAAGSGRLTLP